MFKSKKSNDFYIISLTTPEPFHYKFWGSVLLTVLSAFIAISIRKSIFNLLPSWKYNAFVALTVFLILFVGWIILIIKLWKWYIKKGRNRYPYPICKAIRYFIHANDLYSTSYREKYDRSGKIIKEKYTSKSAFIGCKENKEQLIIRAYKMADKFNDKMNDLDTGLCALLGLDIENKIDKNTYCDYIFRKAKDKRITIKSKNEIVYNDSVKLSLNNNLQWNIQKQPHALIAGGTGSGKTTFINFLIIEMLKMKSDIFICDPKRSDLASLQHFLGKENVASETNQIARLTREVKELMNKRFVGYKENADNFVYGYSFVDYKLKPVFLLFDELGAFRAGADKKVFSETMSNLTEIILKGREMGVFCVLSTQQPNADNIPTELRDNLSIRLALGNMSSEAYKMVFGSVEGLKTVSEIGTGYIYLDGLGWELPKYFEAPYLDYKQFNFIEELKKYIQA